MIEVGDVHVLMRQALTPSRCGDDDWYLDDPAGLGMPGDVAETGPVGVAVDPVTVPDPDVVAATGLTPVARISVWMGCNQDADHLLLGYLCMAFALEFDALVDFHGLLVPFAWPAELPTRRLSREQSAELDKRVAHGMRKLPGRLYTGKHGHIGDAEFLDGWLRHRRFRMIK